MFTFQNNDKMDDEIITKCIHGILRGLGHPETGYVEDKGILFVLNRHIKRDSGYEKIDLQMVKDLMEEYMGFNKDKLTHQ